MASRSERGVTLTELTIVIALAAIVTLFLVTFYFNSQAMWVEGSTQALTQREGTTMIAMMADSTHPCQAAITDPPYQHLQLMRGSETCHFWWQDSLIMHADGDAWASNGLPIGTSKVAHIEFQSDNALVYIRNLTLITADGKSMEFSSAMALMNRP